MRWKGPLDARWLRRWTIRLGLAAWVVLALPGLTVIALISMIGLPLGIAMMATPMLFVVVALANVAQRILRRDGPLAVVASMVLALLFLAGVAQYCNSLLDRRADAFLAGDLDALDRPLRAKSIGLASLGWQGWSKGDTRCNELCQRLLLSGAAERVIVADLKSAATDWTAATPALAYRFEERDSCPAIHVGDRRSDRPVDDAKSDEAMRVTVASGRCLIEETCTLADADAVITVGRIHRGANDVSSGLSLTADTVTAHRASVHLREQGSFVERYRWTGVSVLHHLVVPVPTLVGGQELQMKPGFLREWERRNVRDFAQDEFAQDGLDSVRFVRDELGVNVTVPAPSTTSSPAALIARGLDNREPLHPALQQVIEDFFESLSSTREIDEATRLLAFRALADPRVVAPRESWALARGCAKAGDAVNAELADILFGKLMTADPAQREDHPSYLGYPASYLATAIALLPPRSVLAHRRELEELARDPARRRRAHRALVQLPAFGADAVPTLLFLVDQGCELREAAATESDSPAKRSDREDWQDVTRSGLVGLCRLGGEASAALPPLMERLRDGTLPVGGANRELLLATLVRLGADPGQLRSRFARDTSPAADQDFDRLVRRARSKPDCAP